MILGDDCVVEKGAESGLFAGPVKAFAKANDHTDKRRARCGMLRRANVEAVLWAVRRTIVLGFVDASALADWMEGRARRARCGVSLEKVDRVFTRATSTAWWQRGTR